MPLRFDQPSPPPNQRTMIGESSSLSCEENATPCPLRRPPPPLPNRRVPPPLPYRYGLASQANLRSPPPLPNRRLPPPLTMQDGLRRTQSGIGVRVRGVEAGQELLVSGEREQQTSSIAGGETDSLTPGGVESPNSIRIDLPDEGGGLIDPQTQRLFEDPVIAPNGITYSKQWIEQYLEENGYQLPPWGEVISLNELFVDRVMKSRLDSSQNGLDYLNCPITMEQFTDPVVASDGNSYDYGALKMAFALRRVSPCTREPIEAIVYRNRTLAQHIKVLAGLEDLPGSGNPVFDILIEEHTTVPIPVVRTWSDDGLSVTVSDFDEVVCDCYSVIAVLSCFSGGGFGIYVGLRILEGGVPGGAILGLVGWALGAEVGRCLGNVGQAVADCFPIPGTSGTVT